MVARNTNPSYIADTSARIAARNEAAVMHMEDQSGLRKGVASASLGLANGLDRLGALVSDATAAGLAGGLFGGLQGALVGAILVGGLMLFGLGGLLATSIVVGGMSAMYTITGFAAEYTQMKQRNPEKRTAARADWLAAKGGALEGPGFVPPRDRSGRGAVGPTNPGNEAAVDAATANARADRQRAQAYVDRVAPGSPPGDDARYPYPPSSTPPLYEAQTSFVSQENLRRGREADATYEADQRGQADRLREQERRSAEASVGTPSF